MEGAPKFNPAPIENIPATVIDQKFAESKISRLKEEVARELARVESSLMGERKKDFELAAAAFRLSIESDLKQFQEDFLRNMANARNITDVVAKRTRMVELHNNLHSHIFSVSRDRLPDFLGEWGEDQHLLAA
jgi:hypothetical protein